MLDDIKDRREIAFAEAAQEGIRRTDLFDLHNTIAILVGRAYAALSEGQAPGDRAEICVACLAYDGDTPGPALVLGLKGLVDVEDGFEAIHCIATMISYYFRTTQSYPQDMSSKTWFSELIYSSIEMKMGLDENCTGGRDVDMIARNLDRIARRFGSLFS